MAAGYDLRIDYGAVRRFETDPALVRMLETEGILDQIVAEMRRLGEQIDHEGAQSIDYELAPDGESYRISWGKKYFYMYFFEVGTIHIAPRPFMRPVADRINRR